MKSLFMTGLIVGLATWYPPTGNLTRNGEVYTGQELTFAANNLWGETFPDGQWYIIIWTGRAYWPHLKNKDHPDGFWKVGKPKWVMARWTDTGAFSEINPKFVADLSPALTTELCGEKGKAYGQIEVVILPVVPPKKEASPSGRWESLLEGGSTAMRLRPSTAFAVSTLFPYSNITTNLHFCQTNAQESYQEQAQEGG